MYKWQQVKALKAKGLSIKEITRQLKLSKNTVRKYLRSSKPPRFKQREYKKLVNEYEDKIKAMLEKRYIGTRIYNELLAMDYKGSLSSVHRYISEVQKDKKINAFVTTRFETEPGKQMQYDWKEWKLPVNGKTIKIYIHTLVLGYSRKKYYIYSLSITTLDVIRAIQEGIYYFGGIAPELVIDNPKQMVITHEKDDIVRYNDEFLKFCGLYGIEPSPCQNYRARTKGKSERPFYYLQEHLLRGLQVKELSEFDIKLKEFTSGYNAREHSGLKEIPDERFIREKDLLKNIPSVEPTLLYKRAIRAVSNDGYISYRGGFYPVPMRLSLRDVMIEPVFGKLIRVYYDGKLVVEHNVNLFETGVKAEHPEHKERNKEYMKKREAKKSVVVKKFIEAYNKNGMLYVEGLRENVGANLYWHLKEIMKYTEIYTKETISEVIEECIEIGAYHKKSIERLLSCRQIHKPIIKPVEHPLKYKKVNITRDLSDYKVGVSYE